MLRLGAALHPARVVVPPAAAAAQGGNRMRMICHLHPNATVLRQIDARHCCSSKRRRARQLCSRRATVVSSLPQVVLICVGSVVAAAALLVAAVVLLGVQISGFGFHRRSASGSSEICSWHSFRLPPHAVPAHYNLTFDVSFEQPAQVAETSF